MNSFIQKVNESQPIETGQMAKWLRTLGALAEGPEFGS